MFYFLSMCSACLIIPSSRPHFSRSIRQVSVSWVLCFGFYSNEGLALVVCLSCLAQTGCMKSLYPLQKYLRLRSFSALSCEGKICLVETTCGYNGPVWMRLIVIVNSVSTQFIACYLDLIACELDHLCSGRHMTGNKMKYMNCHLFVLIASSFQLC